MNLLKCTSNTSKAKGTQALLHKMCSTFGLMCFSASFLFILFSKYSYLNLFKFKALHVDYFFSFSLSNYETKLLKNINAQIKLQFPLQNKSNYKI